MHLFILSDLPNYNILFLEKNSEPRLSRLEVKTLGANIHKLLREGFFLEHTIGEFAIGKIRVIIEFYKKISECNALEVEEFQKEYLKIQPEFKYIIENLGENYIKGVLKNHIDFIESKLYIESDSNI